MKNIYTIRYVENREGDEYCGIVNNEYFSDITAARKAMKREYENSKKELYDEYELTDAEERKYPSAMSFSADGRVSLSMTILTLTPAKS